MNREENSRVHREFEKFYAAHPEYRIQANHQIFLDAAEQDGGSEVLTAEWMELQLDSLRGELAVLPETPAEGLNKFMTENPWYDCAANRQMIAQRVHETYETVQQAVSVLQNQLAFDRAIFDEVSAQAEVEERAALIEEIALDFSADKSTQEIQRTKLQHVPIEALRSKVREIQERRRYRSMSPSALRSYLRERREQAAPAPAELPAEITRQQITKMSPEQIRSLIQRYGKPQVDERLGYVKPEIVGNVRNVNFQI